MLERAPARRRVRHRRAWRDRLARAGAAHFEKSALKPWLKQCWCIPPKQNAAFVACMEDVLDVYTRPYDPRFPQLCMDETHTQLLGEVRDPLPVAPGRGARHDPQYARGGVANLFLICEPLRGRRHVTVTARRTGVDWAHCVRAMVDVHYSEAEKVVLVLDQLNTHTVASLYEAFPPAEAKRIAGRLEIHHTPKHGSWLNMAEIEFSVLVRQCLGQRMENAGRLEAEVGAWEAARNAAASRIDWRFTTADARIKLKHLYPITLSDE
ncbi:MAG TPA: IS630 family transposase [Thermomicrobiales bacterium]